ncbi:M61 family metallopeptidase [Paraglaciecola marina]|uniref:M61 family metallopeptidase n=1 Tax=Paraglaciecola marina TaxID=2500157 RepID=UPI00105CEB37|nr:PDZ domain-containing protein [Paraglaciecola marina]
MQTTEPLIHYQVKLTSTTGHLLNVSLTIEQPHLQGQVLSLPAWIPGSYMVRDFAKNIIWINAKDKKLHELKVKKLDKQSWQVAPCEGPLHIEYQIYAFDLSVRGAYINDEMVFFNGTNVFLAVEGQTQTAAKVMLEKPTDSQLSHWTVATTLNTATSNIHSFGEYWANNYDELIDHPVLFGEFDTIPFTAQDVEFELVLAGGHQADTQRIASDLAEICNYHLSFFNGPSPIRRYLFITLLTDNAFGGLEHISSTALMYGRKDLPNLMDSDKMTDGYQVFLSLCSHEFFHTWHVKRTKPEELFNVKLNSEKYTEQLWIYEGFTSYYDDLSLLKTGHISQQAYLKVVAQNLTRLLRNKGRFKQSITDSSFDAWTKFYKQDEGSINHIVSYYNKGAVLALCLDLMIRKESKNQYSLDDVMQRLWTQYGQLNIPTKINCVQQIIENDLDLDLSKFLDMALYSTKELPTFELLAEFGIEVSLFARNGLQDKGGDLGSSPFLIEFGAMVKPRDIGIELTQVTEQTSAYDAGLQVGDILIAIDNWQVSTDNLKTQLNHLTAGQKAVLCILRDKKLKQLAFIAKPAAKDTVALSIKDESLVTAWLGNS